VGGALARRGLYGELSGASGSKRMTRIGRADGFGRRRAKLCRSACRVTPFGAAALHAATAPADGLPIRDTISEAETFACDDSCQRGPLRFPRAGSFHQPPAAWQQQPARQRKPSGASLALSADAVIRNEFPVGGRMHGTIRLIS
jgi:hypothetical protein